MGVLVNMVLYAADERQAGGAFAGAFQRIAELDRILSTYRPESEVRQLVGLPRDTQRHVGDQLWTILRLACQVSEQSRGAFDVTLDPAIQLWRRSKKTQQLPATAQVRDALARCGFQKIHFDPAQQAISYEVDGMSLDFGGIGKGFAADAARAELAGLGIDHALIDVGGDLALARAPPGADGWRVAVSQRSANDRREFITVQNCGVATSGDALQHVDIDGVRYSHIIDPHTGLGVTRPCGVTVVARDGATADAWASAMCVLGPEKSLEMAAEYPGLHVMGVVLDASGELKRFSSPGFPRLSESKTGN